MLLLPQFLWAQTETFDIVTYQPLKGWDKKTEEYVVGFTTVDATGTWCQLGVYKSVASSGNAAKDFASEWKALVKQSTYAGSVEPVPAARTEGGWTINAGGSGFKWEGKDAQVIVMTVSGYGTLVSIMASMNSDKYMPAVERFVESVDLKIPEQQTQQTQQVTPSQSVAQSSSTPSALIEVTGAAGVSGIATSTTNFDDGWVSQPYADYVKVTKGPVTVLLHYVIQVDDEMRQNDMSAVLWNRLIVPRYRTSNLKTFQNEAYVYNRVHFMEGDAVELSTGKNCYVGLRVLVNNGVATCVEIISPSATAYRQEFEDQSKIESMVNYNKFAVAPGDVTGTWQESTSGGIDMYSTVTGAYAGMNMSASASMFNIKSDGTYESTHKGAFGMTGSTKFYDQKYNGKWTSTQWDVTMTNRFEGKTDVFWCEYEAVRGGRVLKLTNKVASGIRYRLVRK
jgi:hypothetical protein